MPHAKKSTRASDLRNFSLPAYITSSVPATLYVLLSLPLYYTRARRPSVVSCPPSGTALPARRPRETSSISLSLSRSALFNFGATGTHTLFVHVDEEWGKFWRDVRRRDFFFASSASYSFFLGEEVGSVWCKCGWEDSHFYIGVG